MTMYTSLSGLQASQTEMSTISNNLANVSTNGFKKSRTDFADVIASNFEQNSKVQVGLGTVVQANVQQFSEGNLVQTSSALDVAISGDGFLAVKPSLTSAATEYTRNGALSVNADNYVTDASGNYVQAYPVDGSGAVVSTGGTTVPLQIPATNGTAAATGTVKLSVNLNSSATVPTTTTFNRFDASSYNNATQTTVYDANGNAQTMSNYYVKTADGTPASWNVYSFVGDQQLTTGGGTSDHVSLSFDSAGKVSNAGTTAFDAFTPSGSVTPQAISLAVGSDTTQLASAFSTLSTSQDGGAVGQFSGVAIDSTGIVTASYSNGTTKALGQVALANFSNPEGLRQLGNSLWSSTGSSGAAQMGAAGQNGLGTLASGMVERSNVDQTEELVDLISAQRNFQANAKALDTQSQLLQTIFNIQG